ncbi:Reverse transcriptase domain-containing protein [Mycena sanguinolenta]|uniref:Reverse transcriptase domain-containing protein n=1 Tax=Mycena sanguinolenta TaxID=230812 RepID=A0A8H6Y3Y3_9AGAR|nr:Reverse transcriptase domain-containing protein [Mycena sanguinolenta]
MDPPGTREGVRDTVRPPRQCPQATRNNSETSGSRGDRGPSPGYPQRGPPCSGSTVALAAVETGKEQQHRHNTRACTARRARVDEVTDDSDTSTEGLAMPSRSQDTSHQRGNPRVTGSRAGGNVSGLAPGQGQAVNPRQGGAADRQQRPPRGCPQDEEHAPAFFIRKRNAQQINNPRIKKNTRASLKLHALNINGMHSASLPNEGNKWHGIHRMMGEKRIGVLIVSETHMSAEQTVQIQDSFIGKRLHIINSEFPDKPSTKGVAIVLNKDHTNIEGVKVHYLIPGRAILAVLPWHGTHTLTVLGIYAPVDSDEEKIKFWNELTELWMTTNLPVPDATGGDLNLVPDAIDRQPHKTDKDEVIAAYLRFTRTLGLIDGWHKILVSPALMKQCQHWEIEDVGTIADHRMVSVMITAPGAPYIGKGRWAMPQFLAEDNGFMRDASRALYDLEKQMDRERTQEENAQTKFKAFKDQQLAAARRRVCDIRRSLGAEKKSFWKSEGGNPGRQYQLPPSRSPGDDHQNPETRSLLLTPAEMVAKIQKRIDEIIDLQNERKRLETRVRGKTELGHITKYAVNLSSDKKPRDTIDFLQRTDTVPARGSKKSSEMAEIARDYHKDLQSDGQNIPQSVREAALTEALNAVPPPCPGVNMEGLRKKVTEDDVRQSLLSAAPGKAAGMDGIIAEFWQKLNRMYEDSQKTKGDSNQDQERGNIVKVLTWVYNDVEEHGVVEGTDFALGWMCPIFKKKDKTDIANYRPITVLNTDYKIFTKALTNKLAEVAPYLIHKDQSGFMKNRRITDAIYLAMEVVEYAEEDLKNGAIVALFQEKAYDKTLHPYLWSTLRKHGIPELFISTVKSLYTFADTQVIINGEISSAFRVTRGVRQGDPLSCLLFNLAIEPLASMLRASNLRGYAIPGAAERAVVQLFADDTTVYLHELDNFADLQRILNKWCTASGAKFNASKTEIIPFGNEVYRAQLLTSRKLNPQDDPIPENVHIVKDGKAVWIPEGFVGNNVNAFAVWTPVLDKVDTDYARWSNINPTMDMRKNIDQIVAGS